MQLFVNARFLSQRTTGVQRFAFEVAKELKKLDISIVFLSPKNIIQQKWADILQPEIVGNTTGYVWEQITLPLFLKKNTNAYLLNLCNLAPIIFDKNLVVIHDLAYLSQPLSINRFVRYFYSFITPKIIKKSKGVFTVSETSKKELISFFPLSKEKTLVAYNGISSDFSVTKKDFVEKEKIILTVGSLQPRKQMQLVIDGFLASNLSKTYKLIIVGDVDNYFAENKLITEHSSILVYNNISDNALIDLYRKAEGYLSASLYEGFGLPILEAIYFDCKILCHKIPVLEELYQNNISLINFQNQAELVQNLNNFVSIQIMKKEIKEALFAKYNYMKTAQVIYQHYLAISKNES